MLQGAVYTLQCAFPVLRLPDFSETKLRSQQGSGYYQAGDTEILIVAAEYSSSAAIVNLAFNLQPPATDILYQYWVSVIKFKQ